MPENNNNDTLPSSFTSLTTLESTLEFIQLHQEPGSSLSESLNLSDLKNTFHPFTTTKSSLLCKILCLARWLYNQNNLKHCLEFLQLMIKIDKKDHYIKDNSSRLPYYYNCIHERVLIELKEYNHYLEENSEKSADRLWNETLIGVKLGDDLLALKRLGEWKEVKTSYDSSLLSTILLILGKFKEAEFELKMSGDSVDEDHVTTICRNYMYMQLPTLALPYLTRLQLLQNNVNNKFLTVINQCRAMIFMHKCDEALILLKDLNGNYEKNHENNIWLYSTESLAYLSSYKLPEFQISIKKLLKTLKKLENQSIEFEIMLLEMMLLYYNITDELDKALRTAQTLLQTLNEVKNDDFEMNLINCLSNFGQILMKMGNELAEVTFLKELQMAEKTNVPKVIVNTLSDLVFYYKVNGNVEKRHFYLKKELEYLANFDGSTVMSFEWQCRKDYGEYLMEEEEYDDALLEFQKALVIVQELHLIVEEANICDALGQISESLGDLEKSKQYYEQSNDIWKMLPYKEKKEKSEEKMRKLEEKLKGKEDQDDYNTILEELSNLTSDFIPHPTRNTVKSIRRQRHRSGISTRCSSRCSHRSFHPSESEFTSEWTDNQSVSGARVVGVGVE